MKYDVIVVGGGAAGLLAAGFCAQAGSRTALIERGEKLAHKVRITGKGRCNVTNNCDAQQVIANVPENGRFLYSALSAFSPADTMRFFEERGVPLKTERGRRVFPQSDKASDIAEALEQFARENGVRILSGRVNRLLIEEGVLAGVSTDSGMEVPGDRVIVCTGGRSYPGTGSTGDGYLLAQQAGHTIVPPRPSLVPLISQDSRFAAAQGLSLRNVAVRVLDKTTGKEIFRDFGELLFTHFGLSGPVVLSASAHMRQMEPGRYELAIDLKPALTAEQLEARLMRDFQKFINRDFSNSLHELLPKSLIPVMIELSGISPQTKMNQLTRIERQAFGRLLKDVRVPIGGFRPIEEAIVTSGGVDVREVSPKTMESKRLSGLYFAGEVLDVDAYTGGFNLQIAFSTAFLAAQAAGAI